MIPGTTLVTGATGKVATLHRWMEQARKAGIHSLVRFVRTLKQDLSAVELAVSEPWSNGPVEGQLNRLKMLMLNGKLNATEADFWQIECD